MDFFDRQEKAHRNTKLLLVYFTAGVTALIVVIYAAVVLIFAAAAQRGARHIEAVRPHVEWWDPRLFAGVAIGTLAVIGIGSAFKTMELSRGGGSVATMLGGRLLNANTNDPDERKLLNVVEEMALASGVPVPQIYVLDQEPGINAFAAGHSTSDAVVGVTRGCMMLLSRDELQGVIAHEFSHILNGDMRLNLRLMGIIFGIICIAVLGRILLQVRSSSSRDKNPLPLLGLVLLLFGWIGVLFGRLIQAAVSRQREFLADASAVQFTRNPQGLAGALKKIGGLSYGSKLESPRASEASHMFFGNGLGESFVGLMATHPPLEQRIRAIEPNFDGQFPVETATAEVTEGPKPARRPPVFPFPLEAPQSRSFSSPIVSAIVSAQAVMPNLGTPELRHLQYAVDLRDSFSPAVQSAARDPLGASALIYGLVISSDPELQRRQLQLLAEKTSHVVHHETARLLAEVASVGSRARLPLVDLALPALRQLSPDQYLQFSQGLRQLIESDNEVNLFEYVLQKIVLRHLDPQFNKARKPVVQYYSIKPLAADCAVLLSALAHVGAETPELAKEAFQRGAQLLAAHAQEQLSFIPEEKCDLPEVDAALNRLSFAAPQIKKSVLNACAQTVAADGLIQEMEAELIRGIADTIDCPIPPFVQPND
jgi:Zn-dependent protease with chaperone function/uncharacterized tellurite resistance protein B-like protein